MMELTAGQYAYISRVLTNMHSSERDNLDNVLKVIAPESLVASLWDQDGNLIPENRANVAAALEALVATGNGRLWRHRAHDAGLISTCAFSNYPKD